MERQTTFLPWSSLIYIASPIPMEWGPFLLPPLSSSNTPLLVPITQDPVWFLVSFSSTFSRNPPPHPHCHWWEPPCWCTFFCLLEMVLLSPYWCPVLPPPPRCCFCPHVDTMFFQCLDTILLSPCWDTAFASPYYRGKNVSENKSPMTSLEILDLGMPDCLSPEVVEAFVP